MNCIVYICNNDPAYIKFLKHSIFTLMCFNTIDIYVLTNKLIPDLPSKIIQIDINKYYEYIKPLININTQYNQIVYYKMFIPLISELSQYTKILYIDVDTEIYKSLNDIFMLPVTYIGAVNTLNINYLNEFNSQFKCNISAYFNTGILLFNKCNIHNIEYKQLLDLNINFILTKYPNVEFKYGDQDIINIIFNKKLEFIPNTYNYEQSTVNNFDILSISCHIKHYTLYSPMLTAKLNNSYKHTLFKMLKYQQ